MSSFENWKEEYGLQSEPNYSEHTEKDCKRAFEAGQQSQQAKIDELQKLRSLDEMAINQLAQANQVWRTKCDELQASGQREGYKLVPVEPSADLVNHGHQVFLGHFNEGGQTGGRSLYFAYKAMIGAQESKG